MAPISTDAIVLHAFDYLETSRIVRLLTREAGVQSVIAKGARRSRARYGSAVDLFAQGEAQIYLKPTRELHPLAAFEVTRARTALALDMDRFLAASALAELVLRVGRDDPNPELFDTVAETLDAIAAADGEAVSTHALAGAWRLVASSGFLPALDHCASCHAELSADALVLFSHPAGGALCEPCARRQAASRRLPASARARIRGWLNTAGGADVPLSSVDTRAHQRLLREFVQQHVTDDRPLRAFKAWEQASAGSGRDPVSNT